MKIYVVTTFLPQLNKAKQIAKIILEKKLAACVNINNKIQSFFWWKNKISKEEEIELSFKTSYKKILIFSIFAALCAAQRIYGICISISFIVFYLF